jgi:nucleotide-sensitive chloride channel 1A
VEPIFEALSHCATLHPDKSTNDNEDMDEAFVDADETGFDTFTGDESQELSEVGRVRSNFLNDNRYTPY